MKNYLKYTNNLKSYHEFNDNLTSKIETLNEIRNKISSISEYNLYNVSKIKEIGKVLKYFYELHTSSIYVEAIMYSIGFNGYIDCIEGLQKNITERSINFATFITSSKKNIFKHSYYANLKNSKPIKNTIKMKKNLIITGPNASGKTTILKSTLINIIFTQQFGCGFYESASLKPYKFIHCYLNIPDTSGRDSLFQAEARRCKEILDNIQENPKEEHFCVFDELYSGTNPDEAEKSATAFMKYLINIEIIIQTFALKKDESYYI
jgi:DNA mismatch repair ATPase MutS